MKPDQNAPRDRMTMKNKLSEVSLFKQRAAFAGGFIVFAFSLLIIRYGWLQLMQHEVYATQSENNRIHLEAIAPPRGFIYDRNGVLLADNRPTFALVVNRQQAGDLDEMIRQLTPIINLMPEEVERFKKRLRVSRRYESVPIRSRMSEEDLASFSERRYLFPGVSAENDISRYYPQGELFAHVLGYVARISEKEQKSLDSAAYAGTNLIGKLGIERYYESALHGRVGYQHVETNAFGRQIRVLKRTPPERGTDLTLSLDIQLQQIAHEQLAGRRGAIVALDPRDGAVLAFVSNPGFDPNLFVGGIPSSLYNGLRDHLDRPLYNRALQGVYPPGSTIKPFEGLGGIHYGLVDWDYRISDPGYFMLPGVNHRFRDWKKQGHGIVNLTSAIEESCDTYFYQLSDRMGVDRFHDWMAEFGFGKDTGIDLVNEKTGTLPSVAWKRQRLNAPWYRGEMMSVGIGQGYFTATPLQIALATAIVANRGHKIRPHLLLSSSDPLVKAELPAPEPIAFNGTPEDWDKMHFAMREVVHGAHGTAGRLRIGLEGYDIAGKTGTAQVKGIKQGETYDESKLDERHYDHAWFMGFAPVDDPVIAVAVLVENGKHGSSTAAPIARSLFDYEINRVMAAPPVLDTDEDSGE
ncbi:penicillin-binding protein 2 [Paraperlucidibaca baekdonensis]|uniref:Peptidoglycan D,D-transpeptidase MrdA n=1 Tax=Paraperlucidibaca baekdonensis TaxID=748120 RepID=A0A3E0H9T2_9GAMM|nr:penicillin-binding protein 2 [Paraperlucidibaca baekdonensis]REH40466.1 penicillin-binding protein 2 [Paraperlucidibaca baekdonensis]